VCKFHMACYVLLKVLLNIKPTSYTFVCGEQLFFIFLTPLGLTRLSHHPEFIFV